jgi:predicted DNA-binding transcriptional regulator AlpA
MMKTLNSEEAAASLGIAPNTLKFWRHQGRGPRYIKLGTSKQAGVAYDHADVEAWKTARKFASTSAATVYHPGNA